MAARLLRRDLLLLLLSLKVVHLVTLPMPFAVDAAAASAEDVMRR